MTEDFGDSEEHAEKAVQDAYKRVLFRRSLLVVAFVLLIMLGVLADWGLAVVALWYVPAWLTGFIVSELAAEAYYLAYSHRASRRARAGKTALLSPEDKAAAAFESLRGADKTMLRPAWTQGIRNRRFWTWAAVRATYSAWAGFVFCAWTGVPAGLIFTAGYTLAAMMIRDGTGRSLLSVIAVTRFLDPLPPRDSPEI